MDKRKERSRCSSRGKYIKNYTRGTRVAGKTKSVKNQWRESNFKTRYAAVICNFFRARKSVIVTLLLYFLFASFKNAWGCVLPYCIIYLMMMLRYGGSLSREKIQMGFLNALTHSMYLLPRVSLEKYRESRERESPAQPLHGTHCLCRERANQ